MIDFTIVKDSNRNIYSIKAHIYYADAKISDILALGAVPAQFLPVRQIFDNEKGPLLDLTAEELLDLKLEIDRVLLNSTERED